MERDKDITSDKDPLNATARKEKELVEDDLNRARGGIDLAQSTGRMNRGGTMASTQSSEAKKEEDEKFERAMGEALRQMREALERRLEEFDRLIAENNARIEELKEEIETTVTLLEKQFGKDWQEKLKKGELDANDPLLRQWLMQQQQLNDYLKRHEKLIQERDDLEKKIAEIEGSNLPDNLKLARMKEVLDRGTSPGVQEVWRDNQSSEHVQVLTGLINTDAGEKLETENNFFPGFESLSVSGSGDFGKGIDGRIENIKAKFANAAELSTTEKLEPVVSNSPASKPPKLPG